ncbi:MAG: hypothetical protein ACFCD0_12325 [Gemmataceae bacterium]
MKKFYVLALVACALVVASEQRASAWSNIKFGAGVNLHWQTGDNTLLWGLFRSGQVPYGGGYPGVPPQIVPHGPQASAPNSNVYPSQAYAGYPYTPQSVAMGPSRNPYLDPSTRQSTQEQSNNTQNVSYIRNAYRYGIHTSGASPVSETQRTEVPQSNTRTYQAPAYWYGR